MKLFELVFEDDSLVFVVIDDQECELFRLHAVSTIYKRAVTGEGNVRAGRTPGQTEMRPGIDLRAGDVKHEVMTRRSNLRD